MRILHIITGAALMAAFVIGCSKSPSTNPVITFAQCVKGNNGITIATFKAENPTRDEMVFEAHLEGGRPGFGGLYRTPAHGMSLINLTVFGQESKPPALSVTLMRLVPIRQFKVTLPNTALEPTPTAP